MIPPDIAGGRRVGVVPRQSLKDGVVVPTITRRGALGAVSAAALTALAACGSDAGGPRTGVSASDLDGQIKGAGATSQADAQEAWMNAFMDAHWYATVEYAGGGSGAGRTKFIEGAIDFAGTDAVMTPEEVATAGRSGVVEVPVYFSPIAVTYNLPTLNGQAPLNMTGEVIAAVFNRDITMWNDPRITALNPGVDLPDLDIITVHRADDSGTTKTLTHYLSTVAPGTWTHGAGEAWPLSGGQSGDGTSGLIATIKAARGTIGYADASKVADSLGMVAVGNADGFAPCTAEAAATTVASSALAAEATTSRLVYEINAVGGGYPIILVSYLLARQSYDDATIAETVKAYLQYTASADGQEVAARASGCAPISEELRTRVLAALDTITASGRRR